MRHWQYLTLSVNYDKKQKNLVIEFTGKPPLVGLSAILEAYGSQGWELVNLQPDRLCAFPGFGKWYIEPETYRATFKRPAADGS